MWPFGRKKEGYDHSKYIRGYEYAAGQLLRGYPLPSMYRELGAYNHQEYAHPFVLGAGAACQDFRAIIEKARQNPKKKED